MLSNSDVVLDWAITDQSDPFLCPYPTGLRGSAFLGKHLPRIRCRRRHELLLILKMLTLLMGEVATERAVPVPRLGLPPKLAPGPSSRF